MRAKSLEPLVNRRPVSPRKLDRRVSLRFVTVGCMFWGVWYFTITGATLTKFAMLLNLPNFWYGVLGSTMYAASLVQLPTSYFIERYGHRKLIFIGVGALHRALWIVIALLPWIVPVAWRWQGLILLVAVSWTAGQVPGPVWVSWMADLVPARIRGRYFSRRTQIAQAVGLVTTLVIGYILDLAEARGAHALLVTTALALGFSGLMGMIDFLHFLPVPEVREHPLHPQVKLWSLIREPLRDANLRRFLLFTLTMTFSIGYFAQYSWLYLFDVAHMSNTKANALLLLLPLAAWMICYPIWGRLIDRLGRKPVLLLAELLFVLGAAGWLFVTEKHWFWGYVIAFVGTSAWAGVDIGNFNVLLRLSDAAEASGNASAYIAVNSAVAAIAGIFSGIFGGVVAGVMGDWRGTFCGLPVTYHSLLFLFAAGLRLVAALALLRVEDVGAASPQAALRYMGTNLYSNFQQAIFLPGRLLTQISRWTYAIGAKKPPPR